LAWANCVTVRLMLSRTDPALTGREVAAVDVEGRPTTAPDRRMHVVVAPHLPHSSQAFEVTADGVQGIAGR